MKNLILATAILAASSSASLAQQPPAPHETAFQMNNVISQWAVQLENDARTIQALQDEMSKLKAKYEPKPEANPEPTPAPPTPPKR